MQIYFRDVFSYVLAQDFISSFHCAIGTRYWYQLTAMKETQCLQQLSFVWFGCVRVSFFLLNWQGGTFWAKINGHFNAFTF